jgi:hypothetical protein
MLAWVGPLDALINPRFTPVHLVRQSQTVVAVRFRPKVSAGKLTADVVEVLKGAFDAKVVTVNLADTPFPVQARGIEKQVKAGGDLDAVMFIGEWPKKPGDDPSTPPGAGAGDFGAPAGERKALVHFGLVWLVLFEDDDGWSFDTVSQPLVATWNGGTDMLIRAVRYIVKDPDTAVMPVRTGVTWAAAVEVGRVEGTVERIRAVDLAGDGRVALQVVSDRGSRLFALAGAKAEDVSAKHELKSFTAGGAIVADLDGDGLVDRLDVDERGSSLRKGNAPGEYAEPVACDVALGRGSGTASTGDFDGDGLLDVVTASNEGVRLWQNHGGGRFVESLVRSGELGYVTKPGAVSADACDLNNDGRQDLMVFYSERAPQVFFNRGFRSFGFSLSMDLERVKLLVEAQKGVQAGCVADFTGDGAQDAAVVLTDGRVMLLVRTPTDADLVVRVIAKGDEPVRVVAATPDRPLGARNVTPGGPPAFVCRSDAGPVTLRWRFPGAEPQSRRLLLVDKPLTLVLEAGAD